MKSKITFFSTYHPHSQSENHYFAPASNFIDALSSRYDWILLVGNPNAEGSRETLLNFLEKHNTANFVGLF